MLKNTEREKISRCWLTTNNPENVRLHPYDDKRGKAFHKKESLILNNAFYRRCEAINTAAKVEIFLNDARAEGI